jgi:hypothetical protein
MKCQADQRRREVSYEVGDFVYLKLQPYRQTSVAFRSSLKLSPRYFDLYQITKKVGPVAYRLALPLGSLIHNVFHVSMLKKHVGLVTTIFTQLPPVTDEASILPQPTTVLDRRVIQKGQYHPKFEVLIKWKGASADDATWEDEHRLDKSYPAFLANKES